MQRSRALRTALSRSGLRRLLGTRLAGQFGDGVFQASLAGTVLFNPEHQASAAAIAAAFAVVLLPYSLVGPFAGVLLDRWWRQRVLATANLLRAVCVLGVAAEVAAGWQGIGFYLSALVVVSVNRFVLSALSAALPHVVDEDELVSVNAFTTTVGAVATACGGGAAIALRMPLGSTDHGYAVIALAAAVPYVLAGFTARGFARPALGPDDVERARRETATDVARGLAAGAHHLAHTGPAARAMAAMGVVRYCYGLSTICMLLLYRNYFTDHGVFRAGMSGLAQVVAALAVGSALAALVTPTLVRRFGFVRWPAAVIVLAAAVQVGLGLPFWLPLMAPAALLLGFAAQSLKISVDSLLQVTIADAYRGRVFSLYDTLFNVAFVAAAASAVALPETGRSTVAVLALGLLYLGTAAAYTRASAGRHLPVMRELAHSAG